MHDQCFDIRFSQGSSAGAVDGLAYLIRYAGEVLGPILRARTRILGPMRILTQGPGAAAVLLVQVRDHRSFRRVAGLNPRIQGGQRVPLQVEGAAAVAISRYDIVAHECAEFLSPISGGQVCDVSGRHSCGDEHVRGPLDD